MPRILFAIVSLLPFTAAALAQSNPPNLPDPTFSQSAPAASASQRALRRSYAPIQNCYATK
jgi:hypothetical protein